MENLLFLGVPILKHIRVEHAYLRELRQKQGNDCMFPSIRRKTVAKWKIRDLNGPDIANLVILILCIKTYVQDSFKRVYQKSFLVSMMKLMK